MAEFLTTNGTSYHIENIILEAKSKLVLVSPYLQISKTFYERLKDANKKGVKIIIIYGKDELKPNEKKSLSELSSVELYFFENLHAKCYFNESKMVITSMNMYEFSEKNNREMGVLINKQADKTLFDQAVNETLSIMESSERIVLKKEEKVEVKSVTKNNGKPVVKQQARGFCIRCQTRIPHDTLRPYCLECYNSWSKYSNPFYEESVCHTCGKFEKTSLEKPRCYDCWSGTKVM